MLCFVIWHCVVCVVDVTSVKKETVAFIFGTEDRGSRFLQNATIYQTTWRHIPEDSHYCEILKSYKKV
jgi:hypothetical protein